MLRITNLTLARGTQAPARRREPDRARRPQGRAGRRQRLRQVEPVRAIRGELLPDAGDASTCPRRGRSRTSRRKRRRSSASAHRLRARRRPRAARGRARRSRRPRPTRARRRRALAELHHRFEAIGGYSARARAATLLAGLGFAEAAHGDAGRELLRRLAHAPQPRAGADVPLRPAAARRADQPPRPRRRAVARGLARRATRARCC